MLTRYLIPVMRFQRGFGVGERDKHHFLLVRYEREADVCLKVRVFVADDEKVQVRQSVNTTYKE